MNRSLAVLCLLPLLATSACRTYMREYFVGAPDQVLATRSDPGGTTETFRLQLREQAVLLVDRESDRERPALGVELVELDKARAERRGVRPYSGLLVRAVEPGSAAATAGVLPQDVLLAVDDTETVYLEATRAFEATLQSGQAVMLKVLRGQQSIDVPLRVQQQKERVTEQERVALEVPEARPRAFAGVTLRGIPAAWCERIWGAPRQAVVVTNVEVGSPAWLAGVRPGDVIDSVDGQPVGTVHELSAQIAALGEGEQPTTWVVRRPGGEPHEGTVELEDYGDDATLWVPLVFYVGDGTYEDRWSVGPFGLLLANRNEYVADTTTRRVLTRNVFSAVLGLLRVESSPHETEVRLLWLIHFDT
jgi:hypothetical protein